MGISIRAYGRHRGVSDAAVRKAIKAGRITAEPDGTIDRKRSTNAALARQSPMRSVSMLNGSSASKSATVAAVGSRVNASHRYA